MKKALRYAVLLAVPLLFAEMFAFGFAQMFPNQFSPRLAQFAAVLDFQSYQDFLETAYHPKTGWRNPEGTTRTVTDCTGTVRDYGYDQKGARKPAADGPVDIITVGDSYTHGSDVADAETYPARLAEITGLEVANHGVEGFGPLQATLRFEDVAQFYPAARIAVLGIMYDNIRRLPNGFRGAFATLEELERVRTPALVTFKPYLDLAVEEPVVRGNLNNPPATSAEALLDRIEVALASDYWTRPRAEFPYLISVLRVLTGRNFRLLMERKLSGPGRYVEFDDPALAGALRHVTERFIGSARRLGMRPVVVMIPRNAFDRTSPDALLASLREAHPDVLFLNAGRADLDWGRYNQIGARCHPSPYGYQEIARYVADQLQLCSPSCTSSRSSDAKGDACAAASPRLRPPQGGGRQHRLASREREVSAARPGRQRHRLPRGSGRSAARSSRSKPRFPSTSLGGSLIDEA